MRLVSVISCKVAKQAAAITGCPPKVVMCPNLGLWLNKSMWASLAIKAPTGIPPPMPLPTMIMSGTMPKCSKPNSFPVRPKPGWISSRMSSAPTSSQRSRTLRKKSFSGWINPAPPCMLSKIMPAVWVVIFWMSASLLNVIKSTSSSSGKKGLLRSSNPITLIAPMVLPW